MRGQIYSDARQEKTQQRSARLAGTIVSRSVAFGLALVLTSACTQRDSDVDESSSKVEDVDADASAERIGTEDAGDAASPAWTMDALRAALGSDGWTVEGDVPTFPDVATPEGTDIDGLTIQKGNLRADVFLYQYPREGYAAAHANAEHLLEHSSVLQQGKQLVTVVSRDREQARAVLDALPLGERP